MKGREGPGGALFWCAAAVGWSVMVVTAAWLARQPLAHWPDLARFLVGTLLAHDALVAPLTVLAGLAVVRAVPARARPPVQAALIVSATVVVFALPFVRGYGQRPDNPSALPLDYGSGLLTVLAVIWLGTVAVVMARKALVGKRRRT